MSEKEVVRFRSREHALEAIGWSRLACERRLMLLKTEEKRLLGYYDDLTKAVKGARGVGNWLCDGGQPSTRCQIVWAVGDSIFRHAEHLKGITDSLAELFRFNARREDG